MAPIHKRCPPCQQSLHIRAAFPICQRRPSIRFHGSHTPPNSKKSDPKSNETCVTVYTNQAPAKSSKCYRPATGGCRHLLHVRSCAHFHGHAHGHGHTCTVTHMHGHGHTFTGMRTATSTSGHASDETSVRLTRIKRQPSSLKCPAAASHLRGSTRPTGLLKTPGGHGRQRRRQRCDAATPRRQGPSTCVSPA